MKLTDEQLKAALVNALPDDLFIEASFDNVFRPRWIKAIASVRETEWPYIAGLVEKKLDDQIVPYSLGLEKTYGKGGAITATWQQRAQALAQIGAITIEQP